MSPSSWPPAREPTTAHDGTLVMLSGGGVGADLRLTWLDRTGKAGQTLNQTSASAHYPRRSPDGRFVAVGDGLDGDCDIWIVDLARGSDRHLTFEPGPDRFPSWTLDGQHVVDECGDAICARPADGSGARVELLGPGVGSPAVSPDGRFLLFTRVREAGSADLGLVEIGAAGVTARLTAEPKPFVVAEHAPRSAVISPDGRFAAYESSEGGTWAVYVTRFPSGEGKWEVFRGFSGFSRWGAKRGSAGTSPTIFSASSSSRWT